MWQGSVAWQKVIIPNEVSSMLYGQDGSEWGATESNSPAATNVGKFLWQIITCFSPKFYLSSPAAVLIMM